VLRPGASPPPPLLLAAAAAPTAAAPTTCVPGRARAPIARAPAAGLGLPTDIAMSSPTRSPPAKNDEVATRSAWSPSRSGRSLDFG